MPLWGKKSIDETRLENVQFLKEMAKTVDLLAHYAEDTEHFRRVQLIQDEINYLLPIEKESIKTIDKKINNCLDDLRISLRTNRDPFRVKLKLDDLEVLIDERNTKI